VPVDLADALIERLLLRAQAQGWEASYDQATEDFYLLRYGPEAAQVRLTDARTRLRIDSDRVRQGDFLKLLSDAQRSIARDVQAASPAAAIT
jgi:hypothetical protein